MSAALNLRPGNPDWKPGVSGNPSGRPKLPEHLRAIASLTQDEALKYISKFARMLPDELEAQLAARQITAVEMTIARIFQEAYKRGDEKRLAFLFDRAFGKVKEAPPPDPEAEAVKVIQAMTDQDLVRFVKSKLPELENP